MSVSDRASRNGVLGIVFKMNAKRAGVIQSVA